MNLKMLQDLQRMFSEARGLRDMPIEKTKSIGSPKNGLG